MEQLAELILKYPMIYFRSKLEFGKTHSPLYLPLNPNAVFKKQGASRVPIHLQDKVNRLLDILEQYEIISPINKQTMYCTILNSSQFISFYIVMISSIKHAKDISKDVKALKVYNKSPYKITHSLEFLWYRETDASFLPTHEIAFKANKVLKLLDICQSTILNDEISKNNITTNQNETRSISQKPPRLIQYSKPQNIQTKNNNFRRCSIFKILKIIY